MNVGVSLESVLSDSVDLTKQWVSVVRAIIKDIAELAVSNAPLDRKDAAVSRWEIFLGTLLADGGEGVVELAKSRRVRPLVVVVRSLFEYQQKAEYFLNHHDEAFEQYQSIGARKYSALSKLGHPRPQIGQILASEYLEWKRTAGARNEWSGNRRLQKMHLENVAPSKVKQDREGIDYTEEFQTAYGIPSLYVHGEPILMAEVFSNLSDESNWSTRESFTFFDTLTMVNLANTVLLNYCAKTTAMYRLDIGRIYALRPQVARVINSSAAVHGTGLTVIPPVD